MVLSLPQLKQTVQDFIAKDKTKDALEAVVTWAHQNNQSQLKEDVNVLKGALAGVNRQDTLGMLTFQEVSREKAKLNHQLLSLLNSIELTPPDEPTDLNQEPSQTEGNRTVSHDESRVPTIVILTAIDDEYNAVRKHLQKIEDLDKDDIAYEIGDFTIDNKLIAKVIIRECGQRTNVAAQEAERAAQFFKPSCMFFVGIAGSRKPNDFKVGDVIFPDKVYYYEGGKATEHELLARPEAEMPTFTLLEKAKRERNKDSWKSLIKGNYDNVKANIGIIASGEQLIEHYNSEIGKVITRHYNDASAVEMEGYGFLRATQRRGMESMNMLVGVIRGISDILEKEGHEDMNSDRRPTNAKTIAADTAAAFTFWLIFKVYEKATKSF